MHLKGIDCCSASFPLVRTSVSFQSFDHEFWEISQLGPLYRSLQLLGRLTESAALQPTCPFDSMWRVAGHIIEACAAHLTACQPLLETNYSANAQIQANLEYKPILIIAGSWAFTRMAASTPTAPATG